MAALLRAQSETGRSLIGLLSLFPGSGCTSILLAAAMRVAASGKHVVMVDGNFCRPALAGILDTEPDANWHDVLVGGLAVEDAVVRALDDGVNLLPFLTPTYAAPTSEWAAGMHATVTAGVLRHAYDLTLVDLGAFFDPPAQPIGLELVRNMRLDGVIAVTGPKPADHRDLETLAEHLDDRACSLIGTIENRVASS